MHDKSFDYMSSSLKAMKLSLMIILCCVSFIQTFDYDIDNQQICIQRPFIANFRHNCSRTRLIKNVTIPNDDQILYISIIFPTTTTTAAGINTSFMITKSSKYNQKIYLTFFTSIRKYMYINNKTLIILNDTSITTYLYDTSSEEFTRSMIIYFNPSIPSLVSPYCILKNQTLFPLEELSRVYYLYTNETKLYIDLSKSSYRISPIFNQFNTCFKITSTLTELAIGLIAAVSIVGFITTILVIFCLKKQLIELYRIWTRWIKRRLGLTPSVVIVDT